MPKGSVLYLRILKRLGLNCPANLDVFMTLICFFLLEGLSKMCTCFKMMFTKYQPFLFFFYYLLIFFSKGVFRPQQLLLLISNKLETSGRCIFIFRHSIFLAHTQLKAHGKVSRIQRYYHSNIIKLPFSG